MIEQTPLEVSTWEYHAPADPEIDTTKLTSKIEFQVRKLSKDDKKGLACRFTCIFQLDEKPLLVYIAGDTYVIDQEDIIDQGELMTMVNNSYEKFTQAFELRKLMTVLHDKALLPFNDKAYDWIPVLDLLK